MKYILLFWAVPMGLFWGWYYLSYNDMHFGYMMLTRDVHDFTFALYGNVLGIDPATIPALVVRACILDTALIFAIFAFRKRLAIKIWFLRRYERYLDRNIASEVGQERPAG